MRRWQIIVVIVLLAGVGVAPFLSVMAWVGHTELPVEVIVVDTEVPCSIASAKVVVFRGPPLLFDGADLSYWKPSDFQPNMDSGETKMFQTDSRGRCSFVYPFWACGKESWFVHSGHVRTDRIWLQVSAVGRPMTLVPLDQQSYRGRDIHDKTPILVTVVLNKNHSSEASEAGASR